MEINKRVVVEGLGIVEALSRKVLMSRFLIVSGTTATIVGPLVGSDAVGCFITGASLILAGFFAWAIELNKL